jgi:hypothetical protein
VWPDQWLLLPWQAYLSVVSSHHAAYEQAVSRLQASRVITARCGQIMVLSRLFGGGEEENIHA